MTSEPEQLQLALEHNVPDSYTVELRRETDGHVVRHHEVKAPEDALALVEAIRDDAIARYSVTWQSEEPEQSGKMLGLAPAGVSWTIAVVPPVDL